MLSMSDERIVENFARTTLGYKPIGKGLFQDETGNVISTEQIARSPEYQTFIRTASGKVPQRLATDLVGDLMDQGHITRLDDLPYYEDQYRV